MATVGVSLCEQLTAKIAPPRTLYVPFPFGFPLGAANDAALQRAIVARALSMLGEGGPPPVTRHYTRNPNVR